MGNKHLDEYERGQIAALHKEGYSPYKIGKILGRASNTIRNELKRGTTTVIKNYFEKTEYIPGTGQAVYTANMKRGKSKKKIKDCEKFIEYVENEVLVNKRSFDAARGRAIREGRFSAKETVSTPTLYRYCDKGLLKVRNIDLPEKVRRKVKKEKTVDRKHKRLQGTSIEQRSKIIEMRQEFGHWEIDLVIGKKSDDNVLLTLSERKTRKEIIRKIASRKVEDVMTALERIKRETLYSDKVFKSITTDNGVEFSRLYELEKAAILDVYYAHPYSSWERGTNERANRIIRRFLKKGHLIRGYSKEKIALVEFWINTLPRKMFDYQTSEELYQMEIDKIRGKAA